MFKEIDVLKNKLDSFRPLNPQIVKNLYETFILDLTYNSNAIEGNTLTLQETKIVLEGITIGGKTLREHFEAINHKEALLYIENLIKSDAKHIPPESFEVPVLMKNLVDWYNNNSQILHPIELASKLHIDFVKIHPFIDGNGRTARVLLNLVLLQKGIHL